MLEPLPPTLPPSDSSAHEGGKTHALLERIRHVERRRLWHQGILLGLSGALPILLLGGFLASRSLPLGRLFLLSALPLGVLIACFCGIWLWNQRAKSHAQTARLVGAALPELGLDVLAAVELSGALGQKHDFSPDLARAFLRQLDAKLASTNPDLIIDRRPTQIAQATLLVSFIISVVFFGFQKDRILAGTKGAFSKRPAAEVIRQPITGDVEVTYRYPAYTGLLPKTVQGTTGELSAPMGTEVSFKTRADRDVEAAALEVDGKRIRLQLQGRRELEGNFIIERNGHYHFVFLDGDTVEAAGPDLPVHVEVDAPPAVTLSSPPDELEVRDEKKNVTLKFEASDDYGLTQLELVYRLSGQKEVAIPLQHDDGKNTRGEYAWNLGTLHLLPGQKVSYFLRATDNDEVSGKKTGVSRTQTLKLYSRAEHRKQALQKVESLWERLILHLADRMESSDRDPGKTKEMVGRGTSIDAKGTQVALDALHLSEELSDEADAPDELILALKNAGTKLRDDVNQTVMARALLLRLSELEKAKPFSARLSSTVSAEIKSTEQSVLYLEGMVDRVKLQDIKDLAALLKKDRRELAELLEQMKASTNDADRQKLLEQIQALRQRMEELSQAMAELASGLHDEFMNSDAMRELAENSAEGQLDEIEKLVKEGKLEEAMAKLQEMSMAMDEQLKDIEQAGEEAEENADPELAEKFDNFRKDLDRLTQEQEQLSEKTKGLRDQLKNSHKEELLKKGAAIKRAVLEQAAQLKEELKSLDLKDMGSHIERPKETALQDLSHLESALKSDDFDLAMQAARDLSGEMQELQGAADSQRRQDELFGNPPEIRRKSRAAAERLKSDMRQAENIEKKLEELFPGTTQQMSEGDQQKLKSQEASQRQLQKQAQALEQQLNEIQDRAPVFDSETERQLETARRKMEQAGQGLKNRDVSRGYSDQQAALESLKNLKEQMKQQGQGKKRMPRPTGRRSASSQKHEKVEIPDEDPLRAPRELRKDVMDAMKQGAPERYQEQVKRYYEELVK